MHQEIIDKFISQMLDEAGLVGMPEDFRADYLKKIRKEIEYRLGRAVVLTLPEADLEAFDKLSANPATTPEQMMTFFDEHIDNFPDFLNQELNKFKSEFIDQAKQLESLQQKAEK